MMNKKFVIILMSLLFVLSVVVVGQVGALSGSEILEKLDENMRADNQYMEQEMVIVSSRGSERSRDLAMWSKVAEDGSEYMLVRFLAPADVAGTGLLLVENDMWLYLPDLGSSRRIAGSAREGNFMGSDFSYEDMEALGTVGFSVTFSAELLSEVEFGERNAFHLQLEPSNDEDTTYSSLEMKVDAEYWLPLKIDYYKDGELLKTLLTSNHQQIDDRWTAQEMEMSNHQSDTKTIMNVQEVDYSSEIDLNVFTERNLERGH